MVGEIGILPSDQPLKRAQCNTLLNCVFFCGSTIGGTPSIGGEESRNLRRQADDDLTAKDKAVYKYRAERKRQWSSLSGSTTLSEQLYNEQYDEEQLPGVKKSLAVLKEKGTPKQRKSGDGSTEQARR